MDTSKVTHHRKESVPKRICGKLSHAKFGALSCQACQVARFRRESHALERFLNLSRLPTKSQAFWIISHAESRFLTQSQNYSYAKCQNVVN